LERVELAPITVLGGHNNVGKTSFLEAMFLLLDRRNPELLLRPLSWRGFSALQGPPDRIFAHAFHDYDVSRPIEIDFVTEGAHQTLRIEFLREYFGRTARTDREYTASSLTEADDAEVQENDALRVSVAEAGEPVEEGVIAVSDGKLYWRPEFKRSSAPLPAARYQGLRIRANAKDDAETFGQIAIESDPEPLIENIREFFPEIRSLQSLPTPGGPMIYADVGLPRKVPVPALGDGAARLISYFLAAYSVRDGGLLLIDELGAGLHHSQLPKLWSLLYRLTQLYSCQVVATTHSYETLAALRSTMQQQMFESLAFVRLDQQPRSREIECVRYSASEFQTALEHEWELR